MSTSWKLIWVGYCYRVVDNIFRRPMIYLHTRTHSSRSCHTHSWIPPTASLYLFVVYNLYYINGVKTDLWLDTVCCCMRLSLFCWIQVTFKSGNDTLGMRKHKIVLNLHLKLSKNKLLKKLSGKCKIKCYYQKISEPTLCNIWGTCTAFCI